MGIYLGIGKIGVAMLSKAVCDGADGSDVLNE